MTVTSILKSIRTWGIGGALSYLRRIPKMWRLQHSDKSHGQKPERGLTLVGLFSSSNGISQTMRNLACLLKDADIPFQVFDTNDSPTIPRSEYDDLLTPASKFDLGRYDHVIELFTSHAPRNTSRLHALLAFWEFESGFKFAFPDSAISKLPLVAMSDFNAEHFRSIVSSATPVFKIRYPLILSRDDVTSPEVMRQKYKIPSNAFVVFFNFDYGSSYYRKNPEAVLRAFAKAFSPSDNVVLLLKTSGVKNHPTTSIRLHNLAKELEITSSRFILVEDIVPQGDMSGFFKMCDVYISLHRGEGFGIGMAEAMSYGKPVIVTNYSSNTEFCTKETSIQVPYHLVAPKKNEIDNPAYSHVTSWAEPDIDFAAAALAKCYAEPDFSKRLGEAGAEFIKDYFSIENFKKDIDAFLDYKP